MMQWLRREWYLMGGIDSNATAVITLLAWLGIIGQAVLIVVWICLNSNTGA